MVESPRCRSGPETPGLGPPEIRMPKSLQPHMIIASILRPLVRFCLRRGVRVQELEALVRRALVAEAERTIREAGGVASVSKISVTTGIHRVEVTRLLTGKDSSRGKHDVLNRVIGLWSQRKTLRSEDGTPRPLTFEGTSSEFAALVASISKEVTHYPILFELERIGAIEYEGPKVRLRLSEYTPAGDAEHGLALLSEGIEDLVATVEGNLTLDEEKPHLHLRTSFDNIDPANLPKARAYILTRGREFQREMREYLGSLDRDLSPESSTQSAAPHESRATIIVESFSRGYTQQETQEIKPRKRGRKPCRPSE